MGSEECGVRSGEGGGRRGVLGEDWGVRREECGVRSGE